MSNWTNRYTSLIADEHEISDLPDDWRKNPHKRTKSLNPFQVLSVVFAFLIVTGAIVGFYLIALSAR